jgi:hypothetical protein
MLEALGKVIDELRQETAKCGAQPTQDPIADDECDYAYHETQHNKKCIESFVRGYNDPA